MHHFAKTGSGQTQGKLKKPISFFLVLLFQSPRRLNSAVVWQLTVVVLCGLKETQLVTDGLQRLLPPPLLLLLLLLLPSARATTEGEQQRAHPAERDRHPSSSARTAPGG
jgi:hypothetical protein